MPEPNCTQSAFEFPGFSRRKIDASFEGGDITSNGGVMLLRQADEHLSLTEAVARAIGDTRRRNSCHHELHTLLQQRIYAIALGFEDLNDHTELRDVAHRPFGGLPHTATTFPDSCGAILEGIPTYGVGASPDISRRVEKENGKTLDIR